VTSFYDGVPDGLNLFDSDRNAHLIRKKSTGLVDIHIVTDYFRRIPSKSYYFSLKISSQLWKINFKFFLRPLEVIEWTKKLQCMS